MTDDTRLAMRPNRELLDPVRLRDVHSRAALVPQTMGEVFEFAKMMASGRIGVPAFLVNNPGDCLRIVGIAARCGLDPFMLADESHEVNKRMAFGAKAIHAIVLASGVLEGDLTLSFAGGGETLTATVTGKRREGAVHTETYHIATITTRNSPLWKQQPRQQLGYYAIRAWCRLHAPDALMGLVAREDAPIDVTPETVETRPQTALEKVTAALKADPGAHIVEQVAGPAAAAEAGPDFAPETGEMLSDEKAAHMAEIASGVKEAKSAAELSQAQDAPANQPDLTVTGAFAPLSINHHDGETFARKKADFDAEMEISPTAAFYERALQEMPRQTNVGALNLWGKNNKGHIDALDEGQQRDIWNVFGANMAKLKRAPQKSGTPELTAASDE